LIYNNIEFKLTKKLPFFLNYRFKPKAYRLLRQGENIKKAIIKAEDIIKLYNKLRR
ncbi:hypothetical protein M431DRAFT_102697, partial [Trichoderma harzianum CBS 226.95]